MDAVNGAGMAMLSGPRGGRDGPPKLGKETPQPHGCARTTRGQTVSWHRLMGGGDLCDGGRGQGHAGHGLPICLLQRTVSNRLSPELDLAVLLCLRLPLGCTSQGFSKLLAFSAPFRHILWPDLAAGPQCWLDLSRGELLCKHHFLQCTNMVPSLI